jgi:hypothetical protein
VQTYTVHEPHPLAESLDERATRLVFVKEGFAIGAFALPALWLLMNRLWLELVLFLLVSAGLAMAIPALGGSPTMSGWAFFVLNLIFGLEARNVHRSALARKGYDLIGVVSGRDLEEAERRFLSEWLPQTGMGGGVMMQQQSATSSSLPRPAGGLGLAAG